MIDAVLSRRASTSSSWNGRSLVVNVDALNVSLIISGMVGAP